MASYAHQMSNAASRPGQPAGYAAPMPVHAPAPPAGTFSPGTKIQVGEHRVVITKYLSEGGFAHVYLVKLPRPVDGTDQAVLKRVAVPDRDTLRGMRTEVETMKRLKGHKAIVTYIDSHASELKGGGYEVFLLMEYCNGGGLIDFMNTRLQHRLTEPEILKIFTDVAEGVACMHYLKPPLLHRDLKVENVLILSRGSSKRFKLCDFGSAAQPRPAPSSVVECRLMDEDVQKHTTMQYRSPEMVDVYRRQPIDEKSDIWALGVLLYKLCYYTTPFEDQGQLAILNASYKFHSYPVFSDRLKQLIASMLRESPQSRPNIYQVLREGCIMQGIEVPVKDIYSGRTESESRKQPTRPASEAGKQSPAVGAVFSPPPQQQQSIPDITPMRRGRVPTVAPQPQKAPAPKPSPSPARVASGDPFAALDSKTSTKPFEGDEISSRFPSLDQFSLLHDQGAKFEFDSPTSPPPGPAKELNQRVADRLADEAFAAAASKPPPSTESEGQSRDLNRVRSTMPVTEAARSSTPTGPVAKTSSVPSRASTSEKSRASTIISNNPELRAISSPSPPIAQPQPIRSTMVSTGTMTETPPPEKSRRENPAIWKVPSTDHHRATSASRSQEQAGYGNLRADVSQAARPGAIPRTPSYQSQLGHARHPSSSRPSLEGGRPSAELLEPLAKSRSTTNRPRPASTHLESHMDFLREREAAPKPLRSPHLQPRHGDKAASPLIEPEQDKNIESNVEFLRSMEESDNKKKEKPIKHAKRSSLSSLSGTKNILAGKFGDAFKRFESSNAPPQGGQRTPSPLQDLERRDLTPIAGSEATDGRSDDGKDLDLDRMTPAMRREIEQRQLEEEERRVEAAAAEYRQRVANREAGGSGALPKSIGGVSRAQSIQNRVQSLLDQSQNTSPVKRQAEGYGPISDAATAASRTEKALPSLPRKPIKISQPTPVRPLANTSALRQGASGSDASASSRPVPPPKPAAKPKPTHLNGVPTGGRAGSPPKSRVPGPPSPSKQHLVGVGVPGRPVIEMSAHEKEDYIGDFTKRYPSLSSIEMVERDLGAETDRRQGR